MDHHLVENEILRLKVKWAIWNWKCYPLMPRPLIYSHPIGRTKTLACRYFHSITMLFFTAHKKMTTSFLSEVNDWSFLHTHLLAYTMSRSLGSEANLIVSFFIAQEMLPTAESDNANLNSIVHDGNSL